MLVPTWQNRGLDRVEIAHKLFKFHHVILCASGNNIFPLVYNAFESFFLKLISSLFGYCDKEEILFGLDKVVAAIEQKDCDGARNQIETIFKNGIEDINKRCIDYSVYWFFVAKYSQIAVDRLQSQSLRCVKVVFRTLQIDL